jgi:hypothetical protein
MTSRTVSRPASLAEWQARSQLIAPLLVESTQYGLAYRPNPSDLFVASFAKCGGSWVQQIVHGLRTRGDMNVEDVSKAIPCLEMGHYLGLDLAAPQPGGFRAIKSHLSWTQIPKGGRYIVSFRDPKDALVSFYNFVNGYWWQTDSVSVAEFARTYYLVHQDEDWERSYWGHLVSWWEQRPHPQVLLLSYEVMEYDLPATVETIAGFLGIALDPAHFDLLLKRASLDFTSANGPKSTESLPQEGPATEGQYARGDSLVKVKNGREGDDPSQLPGEIEAEMDAIWRETVETRTGLESYCALLAAMA